MDLANQTVLVTGGGSGIGLGVAAALAREGCRVAICGRDAAKLNRAAASIEAAHPVAAIPCDVADRESVSRLFAELERLGLLPLDILVNSAGINIARRRMAELVPADWDRLLAVNSTGAFNCMHAALPGMRQRRAGLIVNISSFAGKRAVSLAGPAYCASKFAATALGLAVGAEEQENGIRVTNIYPGEVNTPILDQRPVPVPDEKKRQMLQPEDIADCVIAIARLPARAVVRELLLTPLYQTYV